MVNLQKSGDSAVKIVFTDSDHYLYGNGEIEVPVNSLLLAIDESEMVTFKKLSGDPFLSFRADNSNLGTKAAIEQFYKENMVGAAGISEEEVQDMIDESISGKADTAVVNQAISEATQAILSVSGDVQTKVATSDFNAYSAATETALNAKADTSALNDYYTKSEVYNKQEVDAAYGTAYQALTAHTANTTVHVTSLEKDAWNAKQDALSAGTGIEISGNVISATGGGGMDDDTQQLISTALNDLNDRKADLTELSKYQIKGDYVKTSTLADYMTNDAFDEYATAKERIISGALNDLDNRMIAVESGGSVTVDTTLDSGSTNPVQNAVITQALNSKVDTSAISTAITSSSTNSEVAGAKAVYDAIQGGGGSVTVDDALSTTSENPVANSAITNVLSAYYYARKANNSVYNNPFGKKSSNGCVGFSLVFSNIANPNDSSTGGLWVSKINNKDIIGTDYSAPNSNTFNLSLVETSAITTSMTSSSTDAQVPSAKAVYDTLGGLKLVKLTQAEYDALATKDSSTLYIISD